MIRPLFLSSKSYCLAELSCNLHAENSQRRRRHDQAAHKDTNNPRAESGRQKAEGEDGRREETKNTMEMESPPIHLFSGAVISQAACLLPEDSRLIAAAVSVFSISCQAAPFSRPTTLPALVPKIKGRQFVVSSFCRRRQCRRRRRNRLFALAKPRKCDLLLIGFATNSSSTSLIAFRHPDTHKQTTNKQTNKCSRICRLCTCLGNQS